MATATKDDHLGLVATGYVMVFLMPIAGVIIGLVLDGRRDNHSVAIALLSVLMGAIYFFGMIMLMNR